MPPKTCWALCSPAPGTDDAGAGDRLPWLPGPDRLPGLLRWKPAKPLPEAADIGGGLHVIARLDSACTETVQSGRWPGFQRSPISQPSGQSGISTYAAEILHEQIELLALPQDEGATMGRAAAAAAVIQNILQQGDI